MIVIEFFGEVLAPEILGFFTELFVTKRVKKKVEKV